MLKTVKKWLVQARQQGRLEGFFKEHHHAHKGTFEKCVVNEEMSAKIIRAFFDRSLIVEENPDFNRTTVYQCTWRDGSYRNFSDGWYCVAKFFGVEAKFDSSLQLMHVYNTNTKEEVWVNVCDRIDNIEYRGSTVSRSAGGAIIQSIDDAKNAAILQRANEVKSEVGKIL